MGDDKQTVTADVPVHVVQLEPPGSLECGSAKWQTLACPSSVLLFLDRHKERETDGIRYDTRESVWVRERERERERERDPRD